MDDRDNRRRKVLLLLASYAFYAAWDWRFTALIAVSTLADYIAALRIEGAQGRSRERWLVAALAVNLTLLGFFKYFGFFVDSAVELGELLGVAVRRPALEVILPVGISFFTFQSMSYTLDVHAGRLRATRSLLDVALFVAFFPQLVAGPIVRARHFLPQLAARPRFADVDVRGACALFLLGLFKKVFVADVIGGWIDPFFAAPEDFAPGSSRVAMPLFAIQIYCDFSGYTDMAIASAGLLGYRLTRNFAHPYFAGDVRDFWRRWHISLSTWLRDYLYIPLGGGRGHLLSVYRNLMITMLLGGLWHGANWTFVVWGGLHGLGLVATREWERNRAGRPLAAASGRMASHQLLGLLRLDLLPRREPRRRFRDRRGFPVRERRRQPASRSPASRTGAAAGDRAPDHPAGNASPRRLADSELGLRLRARRRGRNPHLAAPARFAPFIYFQF